MKLTSPAFSEGGKIPNRYSQYGENKIPPLHIEAAPVKTDGLVLIVDDPNASHGTFTHYAR
jgi:hypothetical protein